VGDGSTTEVGVGGAAVVLVVVLVAVLVVVLVVGVRAATSAAVPGTDDAVDAGGTFDWTVG
jgi:hypothetical protein